MTDVAVWGDYEVHFDQLLGRGGMGAVYKARQRSLGRWVAVKILDPSRAPDPRLAQGFLEKFQVEIQALARLRDPRIVTILQAGENDGRFWFAMELIEGKTVERRLFDEGSFPEAESRRIGSQVARALEAAHRQGIVHRDVKPGNIFLLADGSVKLADFGLARGPDLGRTRITDANALACTPEYASPERGDGDAADHRSDLYSLGCVLYEMVTERPPFTGASPVETLAKHRADRAPSPRLLNPEVSLELEAVILKCLEKSPERRYGAYGELIAALEAPPASARASRFWPAAAAAGMALLGVILTAVFTAAPPAPEPAEPVGPSAAVAPQLRPSTPPAPPERLSARWVSPREVELRWKPGTGQASYRLERSDDHGSTWRPVQTILSRTATRTRDAGGGGAPWYRLLATSMAGESGPSNAAQVRRRPPVPGPGTDEPAPESADSAARAALRAVLSVLDRRDPEIQRHVYESSLAELDALRATEELSARTVAVLEATAEMLRSAAGVWRGVQSRLRVGQAVEIRLVDGHSFDGTLTAVSENELRVRTAAAPEVVRTVARKDLSEEFYVFGADATAALCYRALHGDPACAVDHVRRHLAEPDARRLHDAVPALIRAIVLRALDSLRPEKLASAKAVAAGIEALGRDLPPRLHFALEPRALLDYEIRAVEALAAGRFEDVVLDFDLSRQRPAALRRILEDFERRATAECLAGSRIVEWTVRPPDPLEEDGVDKAVVLDQPQGLRRMSRKDTRAVRGFVLEYAFTAAAREKSGWVLILTDTTLSSHHQLAGNERTLSLLLAPPGGESGELLQSHSFEGGPGFHRLAVVPLKKAILVFHDGTLAFKLPSETGPELETVMQLGVQAGRLKLRSLKVSPD